MKKLLTVNIRPLITITLCFIVLCQIPAIAQIESDNDRKGVLPINLYDTRSLSMANTTIADVYGWPAIGINPALSGLLTEPMFIQFNSRHNVENNLMQHNLTTPTLSKGIHHITARFGFLHRGFEFLPSQSSSSLLEPDIRMYRGALAYAIAFSDYFSLGSLHSVSYTTANDNEEAQFVNYIADIGLVYAPDGPVSYAMAVRGLGREITYEIIETEQTTLGSQVARQILEVGVTLRYPIQERTYLSISFANEKRFGQDGLWYKGGFEIIPFSFIDIRGGVMVNFDQSLLIPRAGFGVNAGVFRIDYMIAPKNLTGEQFHQFGITFQF